MPDLLIAFMIDLVYYIAVCLAAVYVVLVLVVALLLGLAYMCDLLAKLFSRWKK